MIMETLPQVDTPRTMTFDHALQYVTDLAHNRLPESLHARLERATALVREGRVWLEDDGQHAHVLPSDGTWRYVNGHCSCEDVHYRAPEGYCKHALSVMLYRRTVQLMHQPAQIQETLEPAAASIAPQGIDPHFIVTIQGTKFVKFAGLLKRAHERGLQELRVAWTYNDENLSLAHAVAVFPSGTFEDCGDASPSNTNKKGAQHFRRCALTRASARALRLALGVDLVAVEELADEVTA
jgi:hypothetical protein